MLKMFLRVPFLYGIKYGFWLHVLAYAIEYIDDDDDDDDDDNQFVFFCGETKLVLLVVTCPLCMLVPGILL